jgi:hypothetical protein
MNTRAPARLLLAVLMPLVTGLQAGAQVAAPRPIHVALLPVEKDLMSGIAWRAMTQESIAIWAREGITVTWSKADLAADVRLPIRFDDREVRKHDPKGEAALGVTLFAGRSQQILVSIARARHVIERRQGLADSGDANTLDIALGILLGRVIAHEVGHALLLTTRHSNDGLMRAEYDAGDVRPAEGGRFALAPHERERLAVRFSNTEPPQVALAGFTWRDAPPVPSLRRAQR